MATLSTSRLISDDDLLRAGMFLESFREPVMLLDTSFRITAWNSMCEAMCGKPAEKALGHPFFALFPHAADNPKIAAAMNQAKAGYASFLTAEDCHYTPGSFDNHFTPLKNGEGAVIGVVHTRHDIAHRLKAFAEMDRLNRVLVRKNAELVVWVNTLQLACKSIRDFLYEPIIKVRSFTNMLLAGEEAAQSETGRSYIERIRKLVDKSLSFTLSLMAYIMPDDGPEPVSEIDLDQVFRFIRNNLQQEICAAGATLEWERLPVVRGARRLIYLLFSELVTNALNFRREGVPLEIRVTAGNVSLELLSEDHPEVASSIWVSVSDNGTGFDKQAATDLFRPFYKISGQRHTPGNGIGLALCKKIMARHNGTISAQGTETGSSFTCSFPDHNHVRAFSNKNSQEAV